MHIGRHYLPWLSKSKTVERICRINTEEGWKDNLSYLQRQARWLEIALQLTWKVNGSERDLLKIMLGCFIISVRYGRLVMNAPYATIERKQI